MPAVRIIIETLFLLYSVSIFSFYFWLAVVSAKELIKNVREAKTTNFDALLSSPFAPMISVLAPAYNESLTIVDNIRALLGLYYQNFEIIVINDGSKDDSLEKTIQAFDLEKIPYGYRL